MVTKYEEIVDETAVGQMKSTVHPQDIHKLASTETGMQTVAQSSSKNGKHLLLIIDMQNDFCSPQGSMFVQGADEDVKRLTKHIYDNIEHYTSIYATVDTHNYYSIFFPSMWGAGFGNLNTTPFTKVTTDTITKNITVPLLSITKQVEYVKELEKQGSEPLTIWPYHCIKGTPGQLVENQLMQMLSFFALTRASQINLIEKGQDVFTEMYGAIRPEVDPTGTKSNIGWLSTFDKFDSIDIAGEAMDYCVYYTVQQLCEYFEQSNSKIIDKIRILKNAMSPIEPNDTKLDSLISKYNLKTAQI